ncbi:MAG: NUDIX hydrolase [Actinomycetota bacterium]|nr:NUDIX hydrolase [Actinomycetota bacterium]
MADAELPKDAAGARNPFAEGFEPAAARPAATILLLRRGGKHVDRRLEVLLVKRNEGARFMPGVWVFPGGRVEADELITGVSGAETDVDADELAHRAAAIRELGEEAGIHLDLSSELVPWSRWITPEPIPIRFDTRFYLALAPAHSPPTADGSEVVDAAWMNPQDALERGEAGEIELVFPTIKQLESLLPYATADQAMEAARATVVEPIMPVVVPDATEQGWRMLMPGDEGYAPPDL